MAKLGNRAIRNLQSAGNSAAKFTGSTTGKAAVGLFRWATTDHSGMGRALDNMPSMGFFNSVRYVLMHFLIAVVGAVLTGALVFILIAYGVPFLISVIFR
jgi:hypothetical protein